MPAWVYGITILSLYLLVVLYMGYRSSRVSDNTLDDYTVASRGFGIFVLLFTYAATFHSAYAFTGIVGFAYQDGISFWVNGLWIVPVSFLFWELGKRLWLLGKRYGFLTLADYLAYAYRSRALGVIVALVHAVFTVPYVVIQLAGSGYIFDTITQGRIPFEAGAAVMLVVMIVYVWVGGIRAVAWTDTLQGIMMFVAILGGSWYVARAASGGSLADAFARLQQELPAWFTMPGPAENFSSAYWVSLWVPLALGTLLVPHIIMRVFTARSLRVLKWASFGGAAYLVSIYTFTPGVGAVGRLLFPDTDSPDQIFVDLLWTYLPVSLAALFLAAGFAAAMSTADSQIHAVSSTVAVDIYQKFFNREGDPEKTKRLMHFMHVLIGVVAYYFVVTSPAALINLLAIALSGTALLAPAFFGALLWKRSNAAAALASVLGGLAVLILTSFVWKQPFGLNILPGMWGLAVGTAIFVVGSYLSDKREEALQEMQTFTARFFSPSPDFGAGAGRMGRPDVD